MSGSLDWTYAAVEQGAVPSAIRWFDWCVFCVQEISNRGFPKMVGKSPTISMGFPTQNDHDLGCEMGVLPFQETPNRTHCFRTPKKPEFFKNSIASFVKRCVEIQSHLIFDGFWWSFCFGGQGWNKKQKDFLLCVFVFLQKFPMFFFWWRHIFKILEN